MFTPIHPFQLLCSVLIGIATLGDAKFFRHDGSFTPDYVLVATAQNISINCHSRYSVVLNGTSPGPPLYMQEGRTTWVRVYNNIPDQNLTVHWHGLSQRTAPFSDGTPQVSQWPIAPMHFFDYEMRPDVGDAGTYFYHSHVEFQAISAHGAIIVKEQCNAEPAYKYDSDITLLLADFYQKNDSVIQAGLLADPFVWSGESNALVVNGQTGTSGFNNATDASCAPYRITVQPGKTYRMRFIGGTAISLVTLGIEGHENLTIIEADAAYTKEYITDHLQVASGQRFSLLFKAKTLDELQAAGGKTNFWIRLENRERPANVSGYALLSYDMGNAESTNTTSLALPDQSPVALPQKVYDWLEYALKPLDEYANAFPTQSTRTITITMRQIGAQNSSGAFVTPLQWAENNDIWQLTSRLNDTPYLIDIYQRGQAAIPDLQTAIANGGWDPITQLFPAKVGEVLDIVWLSSNLPTGGWDIHPMHAHGAHYWDLGSGNGTYDAAANDAKIKRLGYTPVRRDTTMLYRYAVSGVKGTTAGWRAWRLKVDDAGVWMLHCHILQHMIMGMQSVFVMGDAKDIIKSNYVAGYLDYGGSAYGNASYDPLVNHHYHDTDDMHCYNQSDPHGGYGPL